MMSPRYYHVTHFLAYPNEICTVAIRKIGNMQDILFVRIFVILGIFVEKIKIHFKNHIYCPVTLRLSPHPLWDKSFT